MVMSVRAGTAEITNGSTSKRYELISFEIVRSKTLHQKIWRHVVSVEILERRAW